jgi:hypothetical protein
MLLEEDHYREAFDVASIALGIAAEGARPHALVTIAETLRDLLAYSGTTAADLACRSAPPFGSPPPGTDTVPLTIRIAASGLEPPYVHLASVCVLLDGSRVVVAHGESSGLEKGKTLTWQGRVTRGKERKLKFLSTLHGSGIASGFHFDVATTEHSFDALVPDGVSVKAVLQEERKRDAAIESSFLVRWDEP